MHSQFHVKRYTAGKSERRCGGWTSAVLHMITVSCRLHIFYADSCVCVKPTGSWLIFRGQENAARLRFVRKRDAAVHLSSAEGPRALVTGLQSSTSFIISWSGLKGAQRCGVNASDRRYLRVKPSGIFWSVIGIWLMSFKLRYKVKMEPWAAKTPLPPPFQPFRQVCVCLIHLDGSIDGERRIGGCVAHTGRTGGLYLSRPMHSLTLLFFFSIFFC